MKTNIINTKYGPICGEIQNNTNVFMGIPYAKAPIGNLRFKEPSELSKWEDIFYANTRPNRCPQGNSSPFYIKEFQYEKSAAINEDCLYLNIFTPIEKKNCPVAIWIHGGAFVGGSSGEVSFKGFEYAKRGVILVTINYRLGIFGFFANKELEKENGHTGNIGLLDQIFAIKWIKENIENFGGDKNNITIFGQSAGGISIHALVSSPLTKGYIDKAIIQSSGGHRGGMAPFISSKKQAEYFDEFLNEKNLSLNDLIKMNYLDLLEISKEFQKISHQKLGFNIYTPVIDNYVLPYTVEDAVEKGLTHAKAYLIGCTGDDIFKGDKEIRESNIYNGCKDWCYYHEKRDIPSYMYLFDRKLPGDKAGAFHSSELWYMFGTIDSCWRPMTKEDYLLSNRMVDDWCNFFKFGKAYTERFPHIEEYII